MPGRFPIVYVRGFAGDTSGINNAVKDPFYGFNEGSTHVRVGARNEPAFHQFESPLLRLHLDEGYHVLVEGGQEAYLEAHDEIPRESIWVHRFYDRYASTWGDQPERFRLESAALDLLRLVRSLREKSGAPRVHLVAHSMGGLIARCLLQKILPDLGEDPAEYVDTLFTYGTPHGGITFDVGYGVLEKLRDVTGIKGADVFGPRRMYEYLTSQARRVGDGPPSGWDARRMPEGELSFPTDRVFCLVGTNPADYDVAFGLSSATVGARSDGLVKIENAFVPGAHVAYVHRSHSGRYGLVNSEEGYENLRRFLFGDRRIEVSLVDYSLPAERDVTWQAEVMVSVRGLPIVTHERLAAHWCPVQLDAEETAGGVRTPLASVFLGSDLPRPPGSPAMRYALQLRVLALRARGGFLRFRDHLEQASDFADTLVVDHRPGSGGEEVRADWNSVIRGTIKDHTPENVPLRDEEPRSGEWVAHVRLPETADPLLGFGARLRLAVTPWS
ncbi:alpha/beta fold hydrolase [Streptomyces durbertensis]|uniref:alpha/beta fold hydrolase n=1 Tax=Streptomyces durbertensis TaxID=2448886 RepID=UPI002B21C2D3|nr:alpha/beta fold hydrolase [Streptomyces durbertensis]